MTLSSMSDLREMDEWLIITFLSLFINHQTMLVYT